MDVKQSLKAQCRRSFVTNAENVDYGIVLPNRRFFRERPIRKSLCGRALSRDKAMTPASFWFRRFEYLNVSQSAFCLRPTISK